MENETENYIDMFCKMLHNDKLKCTSIRQNILRIFFIHKHITVEVILQKLHTEFDLISSKQSVYATLNLLLSYNIITKNSQKDSSFYELTRHSNHFHLLCCSCNKYIEVEDKYLMQLSKKIALQNSFVTKNLDVTINGICKNCILTHLD